MGWKIGDLGIAGVTVIVAAIGFIPALLVGILAFTLFFVWLAITHLVSAVLYTIAAVGLVWLLSWAGTFKKIGKHPKRLLIFLIIPIAFLTGYLSDNTLTLKIISSEQFIKANQPVPVGQMSIQGQITNFIVTPEGIGLLLTFILVAVVLATFTFLHSKHE
jgi:hypothetical protein